MMGISWGGFNALQVAALDPPALKAIITLCSTDDRYADDAHYSASAAQRESAVGRDLHDLLRVPAGSADRRRALRDVARAPRPPGALSALWLQHQWRDGFGKHGSVCEDYWAIRCAVYAIGGWADGYSNAVPRLMRGCPAARRVDRAVGAPLPAQRRAGPAIGFLQEAVRWWDHWLKGIDTGIMDEPPLRVWMQESVDPQPYHDQRPGRWVAERSWPPAHIEKRRYYLKPGRLDRGAARRVALAFSSLQTTGLRAGEWCAFGAEGDAARSAPRRRPLAHLRHRAARRAHRDPGAPVVELDLAADEPNALVAIRLNDVQPDGTSALVTYGLLKSNPSRGLVAEPLEPGAFTGQGAGRYRPRLPAGHRIRIAVSTSYWPIAWPSPEAVILTLRTGNSALYLPVRRRRRRTKGCARSSRRARRRRRAASC